MEKIKLAVFDMDGLMLDTEKLLGRRPTVMLGKNSGLAGIAYWINENYALPATAALDKKHPVVLRLKEWIDAEYRDGRQTALSPAEIEEKIEEFSDGALPRL